MPMRFTPEGWLIIIPFVILAALALLIQWYVAAMVLGAITLFLLNRLRLRRRNERGAIS
jgi:hypothetical protein